MFISAFALLLFLRPFSLRHLLEIPPSDPGNENPNPNPNPNPSSIRPSDAGGELRREPSQLPVPATSMGAMTSNMVAKFAFFPPDPSSYGVAEAEGAPGGLAMTGVTSRREVTVEVRRLRTRRGSEIIAMYVRNPSAKLTLLYSHGNAADLGQMYELFVELSVHLGVNLMGFMATNENRLTMFTFAEQRIHRAIISRDNLDIYYAANIIVQFGNYPADQYDYSGYGQSSGKPSEQNTYADIEAVYKCLEETYGTHAQHIILYGQSVGTGPTLDLAARLPCLRSVILHSAILSGLRVMYPMKRTYWFDIYKNIDKILLVNCPVLVIHGTADEVVDCSHGKKLWELCKEKYEPLWIKGGNHCNLELYPEYIKHLKKFISAMEKSAFVKNGSAESLGLSEAPRTSSERSDIPRKSTDQLENSMPRIAHREKPRNSTDRREKSRSSTEKIEKSIEKSAVVKNGSAESLGLSEAPRTSSERSDIPRKSTDQLEKSMPSIHQRGKSRNSADRREKSRSSTDKIEKSIEKSVVVKNGSVESLGLSEAPRTSSERSDIPSKSTYQLEKSKPSIDHREKSRNSTDQREKSRNSTDQREKSRSSTDKREKSRRSVDHSEKSKDSMDQLEKPRKSIDRFGHMIKSVGLCNVSCFKDMASRA